MPLRKLQLRPGVNRESTSLANEGGWFESDKVRFRSGQPEKIGGWVRDIGEYAGGVQPPTGMFWGVCRHLNNWRTLSGFNLLAIGTNLKFHIQNGTGGPIYDVTPIERTSTPGTITFTAVAGDAVVLVTHAGHGAVTGDFVIFSGAEGLGGDVTADVLNTEYQVTFDTDNTYTIVLPIEAAAGDTGDGGTGVYGSYLLPGGGEIAVPNVGWGAGGYGGVTLGYPDTGYGDPAPGLPGYIVQPRLWSSATFGQDLVLAPSDGGPICYWAVGADPTVVERAQIAAPSGTLNIRGDTLPLDSAFPLMANGVLVSDTSRFVIAFGVNDYGSTDQDPLLVRWSDQEQFGVWQPAVTNQAGSYRLSHGSEIVAAIQTRQEILVFTDYALYTMQYLGPPYVWGTQLMGDNISIAGANAVATASGVVYWLGVDKFYKFTGRVETLECTLRQYVFGDHNATQQSQFFACTNEGFNEVWWFYCSANSDAIDRYVIYNYVENTWAYGTLERTAWMDSPLRTTPVAVTAGNVIVYHEIGTDDGSVNPPEPIVAYIQSADADIDDGHNFGFVSRIIPDLTFDGSTVNEPSVTLTVRPRTAPGADYGSAAAPTVTSAQDYTSQREYTVQQFTPYVYVRLRGRQMAFKITSSGLGVAWQLGATRIDVRSDGRR